MAAASLGSLFTQSWDFCVKTHHKTMLGGILIFGILFSALIGVFAFRAVGIMEGTMDSMFGIDQEKVIELEERIRAGDEAAITEMELLLGSSIQNMNNLDEKQLEQYFIRQIMADLLADKLIVVGGLGILALLMLTFLSYFFIVIGTGSNNLITALAGVPILIVPLIFTLILVFFRSFVWIAYIGKFIPNLPIGVSNVIAFIGIALGIYFFPRLMFAPYILARREAGPINSIILSLARTKGYWLKAVTSFLVIWILGTAALIAIAYVLPASVSIIMNIGGVSNVTLIVITELTIYILLTIAVYVFTFTFVGKLYETISQNPKGAV